MARIPYPKTFDPRLNLLPAPLNVFRMVAHAAPLLPPLAELGMSNLTTATLAPRPRELVILTVARVCRCPYLKAQHDPIAIDAGVTSAELSAIADGSPYPDTLSDAELTVLSAAVEMLTGHTWSMQTVATLRHHYDDRRIVELAITVGYYTMLSGIMNGLDIDIDPLGERFTEMANRR